MTPQKNARYTPGLKSEIEFCRALELRLKPPIQIDLHSWRRKRPIFQSSLVSLALCALAFSQTSDKFTARLSSVPADTATRAALAGKGTSSGILEGATLVIKGSFEGLASAATAAQIHQGRLTGVRGPAIFDLTVAHSTSGVMTGSFNLNPGQIEALKKGQLYVEVQSEKAPDGNLWGWLLR